MSDKEVQIVYDKQCPACSQYCELYQTATQKRSPHVQVRLVDARDPSAVMTSITANGLDIDEGMVVAVGAELHYGADAIHALALLNKPRGWFGRVNRMLFGYAPVARLLYPLMKSIRNLLLKYLGVKRINNLQVPGRERF